MVLGTFGCSVIAWTGPAEAKQGGTPGDSVSGNSSSVWAAAPGEQSRDEASPSHSSETEKELRPLNEDWFFRFKSSQELMIKKSLKH